MRSSRRDLHVKVLHVSHTATVSGAEHSLLTALPAMPKDAEAGVATPDGELADAVGGLGLPVHRIPTAAGSLALHPLRSPVAVARTVAAGVAVRSTATRAHA